ncbi:hypothetical protein [Motiliproteus sp. MSK22-1]|nr:hypothetical protein [Motiliproteus sp. MSK22-1]
MKISFLKLVTPERLSINGFCFCVDSDLSARFGQEHAHIWDLLNYV